VEASVVISYYKNLPNLELILLALNRQTAKVDFEVVVSEDDNAKETVEFLNQIKPKLSYPIIHLTQPDSGFRKCKALNNAIAAASADFLIFLDGDCIPHPQLVKEYLRARQDARVLYGRRVMLSEIISEDLLQNKNLGVLDFFNLLRTKCKRIEESLYLPFVPERFKRKKSGLLLGCNMGIAKKELMAINGFDEDFTAPGGGEDSDIEWRLKKLDHVSFFSMKFRSIVYHIYHPERFSREMELKTNQILANKMQLGFVQCRNGLKKL
jgi:cellulose synthase/poly-beta-1,6-N-acetylglucosamine synthase-like glycosyltransferase